MTKKTPARLDTLDIRVRGGSPASLLRILKILKLCKERTGF